MSRILDQILKSTDTWDQAIDKVNESIETFTETLTLSSNSTLDISSGNGYVVGTLGADFMKANILYGGNSTSNSNLIVSSNIVLTNSSVLLVNNSFGTSGSILTSNGTGLYWNNIANSTLNILSISSNVITSNIVTVNTIFTVGNSTVNSTINSTSFSGTSNNSLSLGGILAASYIQNTDSRTLSGNLNFTGANVYFTAGLISNSASFLNNISIGNSTVNSTINSTSIAVTRIVANSTFGSSGQLLASNGTSIYWSDLTLPDQNNLVVGTLLTVGNSTVNSTSNSTTIRTSNLNVIKIIANSTFGTDGQLLLSNGSGIYWSNLTLPDQNNSTVSTLLTVGNSTINSTMNSTSIAVTRIVANSTFGTDGQLLISNGSSIYWGTVSGGATLIANSTDTQTYYIPMSNSTSGSWSNGVVSSTKLYFVPSTGTLNATIFNSLSDNDKKTNVQTIENALEKITTLRGVEFNWIENDEKSAGVIGQEIESILPHLVNTDSNGVKSVNYSGIIAYLIEAIKELEKKIK